MSKLSRRDFLKTTIAGAGAITLGGILDACSRVSSNTQTPSPFPTNAQPTTPSRSPTNSLFPTYTSSVTAEPTQTPTPTPVVPPDLVVTKLGEPEELVRQSITALGGMERFVPKGAKVVIKPNICVAYRTYEYAATTNPWVVGTLVKLCFEAGAGSVNVMDNPFNGTQQAAYLLSGIREQVEAAGGKMAYMLPYKYISTTIPNAIALKKTDIYEDILQADVLINVPIAKTHSSSRLTLGMKNLMGVVADRGAFHLNLGQSIADLNSVVRPQLTVIDAVRILTAFGPTGGSLSYVKKLDTVVASTDIVAADSYAASLFSLKPEDLDYIVAGTAMGLGRSDLQNMKIEQISAGT